MNDIQKNNNKDIIHLYGVLFLTPLGIFILVVLIHLLLAEIRLSDYLTVFWGTANHPLVLALFTLYFLGIIMPITYLIWKKRKSDSSGTDDDREN